MKYKLFFLVLVLSITIPAFSYQGRKMISLDGEWKIAQGDISDSIPSAFPGSVPVPGLADMVKPAFTEVGIESSQRKAFWYKRSFRLDSSKYPVAILKVNKAQFGIKVWVNGISVGEHLGCATPGYFDVSNAVRHGALNTLLIRVGSHKTSLPEFAPVNTDYEQSKWIPGIYDSVTLNLMDELYIKSIQVAPDISNGIAKVRVVVANTSTQVESRLAISAREWRSGRTASVSVSVDAVIPHSDSYTIDASVKLDKPHLWSPEDPFLYVVKCSIGNDSLEARFGMREFKFDIATGRAMLNGEPYYLRGTNFCIFRFFEDPKRSNLPWDRKWVRKLLTTPKELFHWNSARVCIAPFPEFWYDIADETGWLLQDEFPIWGFNEAWSQDELVIQFKEWLAEQWNHPSVAVWDACNETLNKRTGDAISAVRDMDMSGRPWDDGYSEPNRIGDPVEQHPYTTIPLWTAEGWTVDGLGNPVDPPFGLRNPPLMINEYDSFWIYRDGSPTTIFKKFYADRIGKDAAPNEVYKYQAYLAAAVTEYWRASRKAAGVHWFCYLTYSSTVTGDNFIDIEKQTMSPYFIDYMSNAFSPVAVMLNDTESNFRQGKICEYRIIITNDLNKPDSGVLRLILTDPITNDRLNVSDYKFAVDAYGQSVNMVKIRLPYKTGRYLLSAEIVPQNGSVIKSRRYIDIVSDDEMKRIKGISGGCKVAASSSVKNLQGYFPAEFAVDGKNGTRWSSEFGDDQWFLVDLASVQTVCRVSIIWETAFGKEYKIQTSVDGANWKDAFSVTQGKGGIEDLRFDKTQARYVRFLGIKRATEFGYSFFEFKVFPE